MVKGLKNLLVLTVCSGLLIGCPRASTEVVLAQTSTALPAVTAPATLPQLEESTITPTADNIRILYSASTDDFANPDRGFMKQMSIFPDQGFDPDKIKALQPSDSLVWIYFRLDNYRAILIDQNGLNTIRSAFSTARSKGLKLVIRFAYNDGPGSTTDPNLANPDAPIDLVLQHIDQLEPILIENADVIAVLQAGFVGYWGEWHSTKYLHPLEYRKAIVDALLQALPQDRMLQLRYPRYKEIFFQGPLTTQQAFSGTDQSRVGEHNDCFLQGYEDSGTYSSNTAQQPQQHSTYCDGQNEIACWKGFVAQEGNFTPVGGESCEYNPPRTDCPNALQELKTLHWSFLNNGYKKEVLDSWVSGGCMDTIRRNLGYRVVLKEASLPQSITPGGTLSMNIKLSNDGFAAMYNPHSLYVVLLGTSSRYEIPVTNIDARRWAAGQEQNITINVAVPANVPPGTYKLGLWLPDVYTTLRGNPAYSVRFANANVWDAATGINILTVAPFVDVPTDYWAYSSIERLFKAGVSGGCATNPSRYCPESPITRAQIAIFLERGMKGSSYTPPTATGTVFTDIPASYWAAAWIEQLAADGITGGCGNGNYCPESTVTRAQMAVFLLRAKHGSTYSPPAATGIFDDVPNNYWAAAWIEQLAAEGITGGCGNGNYCPDSPVTRAQMAVFLVRTFNLPEGYGVVVSPNVILEE
jgi:Domain of unknown function (DUF4832)/Domain of unknown function (DUF4874)/S-layer homology domain